MSKTSYILAIAVIFSVFLTGCGRTPQAETVGEQQGENETKQTYYIDASTVEELSQGFTLKKTGKIISSQDIVVSADTAGRVRSISAQIGENVNLGKTVVSLSDSSGVYSFASQRAKAALDQARINYKQTMLSLDKAISDTNLAIKQAENQAQNAQLGILDSGAQQQLNQLQSQLDKANIDLQSKIVSDEQTIQNSIASARNLIASVKILYQDVITTTDELLSVSFENQNTNREFERYLSVENTAAKYTAENTLRQLLLTRDTISTYNPTLTAENLSSELRKLEGYVNGLLPLLDQVDLVLTYTDTGERLPQAQLDGFKASINGLQAQTQGQAASLIQQANGIESFLSTYQQQQESIRKSITSLEQQIKTTETNLRSVSVNTDLGLESARNTYQNTLENKRTTEQALLNAITQAQIAYNETQNNLGKLTVEAPISGTIGDILVDIGQEVAPGTPLFTLASNDQQEIEIALTSDEVPRVQEGVSVTVRNNDKEYAGTLVSVANASVKSLTYKAIVRLEENVRLLGGIATVQVPLQNDTLLLPLKNIKVINGTQGSITLWKNNTLETKLVEISKVRGSNIEITTPLDGSTTIVTSDVSNFDPLRHTLQRK